MMGKHQPQKSLFSYSVGLDKQIRNNHPLRKVVERIDFSFVREEFKDCYGHGGLDPELLLKLMFVLFWDNVRSERELMQILPERLDYFWFLGYILDDDIPDHSVLSKARVRWGQEVFETLFICTVKQCVETGLVGTERLHMDGSLIDADASRDSIMKGPAMLMDQLRDGYQVVRAKQYGAVANFRQMQRMGITTHMAEYAKGKTRKLAVYGDERFSYDTATDHYICQAGNQMYPRCHDKSLHVMECKKPERSIHPNLKSTTVVKGLWATAP